MIRDVGIECWRARHEDLMLTFAHQFLSMRLFIQFPDLTSSKLKCEVSRAIHEGVHAPFCFCFSFYRLLQLVAFKKDIIFMGDFCISRDEMGITL